MWGVYSSSPCRDVIWNDGAAIEATMPSVRLLVGVWVVILKVRLKNTWKKVFVPSRRRELKWYIRINTLAILSSSPRGDVNWNTQRQYVKDYSPEVRLLTETWVEILIALCYNLSVNMFVSLRRRELKLMKELPWSVQTPCSSPYGDVSWNYDLCLSDVYHWVRLLTETWVEMPNNGKRGNLSDVRLLTETWVEMQKQLLCPRKPLRFVSLRRRELKFNWLIKTATKLLCSSPCGDVNWNR